MGILRHNHPLNTIKDHDFWRYSMAFYREPAVEMACLFLQNHCHLNINILLCCLWCAASDRGKLSRAQIQQLRALIDPWQQKLTLPLRNTRRKLSPHQTNILHTQRIQPLYNDLLELEIFSEKIQQCLLFDFLLAFYRNTCCAQQKMKAGLHNVQNYLSVVKAHLDDTGYRHMRVLLATAFSTFVEKDYPQMNLPLDLQ